MYRPDSVARINDILGAPCHPHQVFILEGEPKKVAATAPVLTAPIDVALDVLAVNKVIFNPPATIVYWKDGTKTVVQCYDDIFSEEHGFAMACMRKIYGSRGKFKAQFKHAYRQPQKEDKAAVVASADPIKTDKPTKSPNVNVSLDELMKQVAGDNSMGVVVGFTLKDAS